MFEIKNKESLKSRHGEVCREGILTVSPCWLNWRINPRKDSLTHIVSKGEDWRLTDWLTDYWLTDDWLTQPSKYSETGLTQMVRNGKIRLTDYVTEGMVRQDWLTQLTRLMWNSDTRLTDWLTNCLVLRTVETRLRRLRDSTGVRWWYRGRAPSHSLLYDMSSQVRSSQ